MRIYDISRYEDRILGKVLTSQAEHIGDTVYLRSDERRVTFAEADALVNRYANGLRALGVAKGDTVTLVTKPSIDAFLVCFGISRAGGIFTTVSTDYRGAFLQEALETSCSKVLVIDADLADRLDDLPSRGQVKHIFTIGSGADTRLPHQPLEALLGATATCPEQGRWMETAQIWWSSGTTGKSKGIMHSHSSILFFAHSQTKYQKPGDVMYSCTPMYLGSPWIAGIWPGLVGGITAAIDPSFSVSRFWERIRYYDATFFCTLGAMHIHLWQAPPHPDDRNNRLRRAIATPIPYDIVPGFKERFKIAELPQTYGQSETYQVMSAPDDGTEWDGTAIGHPLPHWEVKLVDEDDLEVPVRVPGEICVRPKEPGILFNGYFNMPEFTNQTWRNLWHHTGDMAFLGENGIYYFADRKKDYIRYKGRNIAMAEVELIVEKHPAVKEVAAFGIQSKELATEAELMLAVVPKPGQTVSAEDLARFINDNAPHYFVPRYLDFVSELPRNPHGRVVKPELRERGVTAQTWDRDASGFALKK